VTEDWPAVAKAIKQRLAELDLSQRELIERSRVSKAIVNEIQHNTVQRRRSKRTLEALSAALDWHPGYLAALLRGDRPPLGDEPLPRSENDIPGRLAVIEHYLREIIDRFDEVDTLNERIDEIHANVESIVDRMKSDRKSLDS
jgi:hypothetical protein